jgi:hypothetical protein
MPPFPLRLPSVLAFVIIPVVLVALTTWGIHAAWRRAGSPPARARRAALLFFGGAAVWMALTWWAADTGILLDWDSTPPPFAVMVVAIFALAAIVAAGKIGLRLSRYLPLWMLVGVQGFRWPLEVAMHRMFERGVMPEQMSYSGQNFDIVTGISAVVVALLIRAGVGGRRLAFVWNLIGLGLLINIVTVAIVSTPRFAWFGPDRLNVWVMYPPFVWLPAVMVLAALAGHLIVFRAIRAVG